MPHGLADEQEGTGVPTPPSPRWACKTGHTRAAAAVFSKRGQAGDTRADASVLLSSEDTRRNAEVISTGKTVTRGPTLQSPQRQGHFQRRQTLGPGKASLVVAFYPQLPLTSCPIPALTLVLMRMVFLSCLLSVFLTLVLVFMVLLFSRLAACPQELPLLAADACALSSFDVGFGFHGVAPAAQGRVWCLPSDRARRVPASWRENRWCSPRMICARTSAAQVAHKGDRVATGKDDPNPGRVGSRPDPG